MNNQFNMYLNILTELKSDPAKIEAAAKVMKDTLEKANPEMKIDSKQMTSQLKNALELFNQLEKQTNQLNDMLGDLNIDIDAAEVQKVITDLGKAVKSADFSSVVSGMFKGFNPNDVKEIGSVLKSTLETSAKEGVSAIGESASKELDGVKKNAAASLANLNAGKASNLFGNYQNEFADLKKKYTDISNMDVAPNAGDSEGLKQITTQIQSTIAKLKELQGSQNSMMQAMNAPAEQGANALKTYEAEIVKTESGVNSMGKTPINQEFNLDVSSVEAGVKAVSQISTDPISQAVIIDESAVESGVKALENIPTSPILQNIDVDSASVKSELQSLEATTTTPINQTITVNDTEAKSTINALGSLQTNPINAEINVDVAGAEAEISAIQTTPLKQTIEVDTTQAESAVKLLASIDTEPIKQSVEVDTASIKNGVAALKGLQIEPITEEVNIDTTSIKSAMESVQGLQLQPIVQTVTLDEGNVKSEIEAIGGETLNPIVQQVTLDATQAESGMKTLSSFKTTPIEQTVTLNSVKMKNGIAELQTIKLNPITQQVTVDTTNAKAKIEELNAAKAKMEAGGQTNSDEYKNLCTELEQINQAFKEEASAGSQAGEKGAAGQKMMAEETAKTAAEMEKLTASQKSVSEAGKSLDGAMNFSNTMVQTGLVSEGVEKLKDGLNALTGPFLQLDKSTQQIKTLGGEAAANADKFKQMSLSMASSVGVDAQAIQDATYDALSAGISANEQSISSFMEASSKLAVGGNVGVKDTVNLLSSMLNAYGESATKTSEYSDILFETVNLGKISVGDMVSSMSQVVPNAAAMGYSLKDVGVALSIMTANGIPAAQATTKLNQMLVEIQKPSADLSKYLGAAGLSAQSLGEQIKSGDVVGALSNMKQAFDTAGVSATQAFSSTEASAAFNTLTKDMGKLTDTTNQFADCTGTTEAAFGAMEESVSNRSEKLRRSIETMFMSMLDGSGAFGTLSVTAAKSLEEISPMLMGFNNLTAAMKTMKGINVFAGIGNSARAAAIGVKNLGSTASATFKALKAAGSLKNLFSSGVEGAKTLGSAMKASAETGDTLRKAILTKVAPALVAETAGTTGVAAAETAKGVAGVTANSAILVSMLPLVAMLAGVAIAILAIIAIYKHFSNLDKEKLESLNKQNSAYEKQENLLKNQNNEAQNKQKLISEYERLGSITNKTASEQAKFNEVQMQIAQSMPGVISSSKSYEENLAALKAKSGELTAEMKKNNEQLDQIASKKFKISMEIDNQKMKMAQKDIADILDLNSTQGQEIQVKIDKVKYAKNDAELKAAQNDLRMAIYNTDNFANLSAEDKKKVENGINQIGATASTKMHQQTAEMKRASTSLAESVMSGDFQANYDKANKQFKDGLGSISDTMTIYGGQYGGQVSNINGTLSNVGNIQNKPATLEEKLHQIAKETGKTYDEVKAQYEEAKDKITKQNIGDAIAKSASIQKGQIETDGVDQLVEKFNNAKTASEKADLAEKIKKSAPEAVKYTKTITDENGKLVQVYEIEADKIEKSKQANKNRLSKEALDNQNKFNTLLGGEATEYNKNQAQLQQYLATIQEKKKALENATDQKTKDTLTAEINKATESYNKLNAKTRAGKADILNNAVAMKQSGVNIDSTIQVLAKRWGMTKDEVKKLIDEQEKSKQKTQEQIHSAKDLADAISKSQSDNESAAKLHAAAAAKLNQEIYDAEKAGDKEKAQRLKEQRADERKLAKDKQGYSEADQASLDCEYQLAGITEKKTKEAKNQYEIIKAQAELEMKSLERANDRAKIDKQNEFIKRDGKITAEDQLELDKMDNQLLKDKQAKYIDIFHKAGMISEKGLDVHINRSVKDENLEQEKSDIEDQLLAFDKDIQAKDLNTIKVRLELEKNNESLQKEIDDMDIQKLEMQVELGIDPDYTQVIAKAEEKLKDLQKAQEKASANFENIYGKNKTAIDAYTEQTKNGRKATDEVAAAYATAQNQVLTAQKELDTAVKNTYDQQKKITDYRDKDAQKAIEELKNQSEKTDEVNKKIQSQIDLWKRLNDAFTSDAGDRLQKNYDKETSSLEKNIEKKKKLYEQQKSDEIITEDEYNTKIERLDEESNNKKLKMQEKFEKQKKVLAAMNEGAQKLDEYNKQIETERTALQSNLSESNTLWANYYAAVASGSESKAKDAMKQIKASNEKTFKDSKLNEAAQKQIQEWQKSIAGNGLTEEEIAKINSLKAKLNETNDAAVKAGYQQEINMITEKGETEKTLAKANLDAAVNLTADAQNQIAALNEQLTNTTDEKSRKAIEDQIAEIKLTGTKSGSVIKEFTANVKNDLGLMKDELGGAMADSITAIFAGDGEISLDSWRNLFGTIAGMLKKEASAAVAKMVLNYLNIKATSPWAWLTIPAITAVANGAVSALINPIVSELTSFSTGGAVTGPTLAIVGDASNLGSSNKEWIFRDDQLIKTVQMAANMQNNATAERLARIETLLANQRLETTIKGEDIHVSQIRTQSSINRRAR